MFIYISLGYVDEHLPFYMKRIFFIISLEIKKIYVYLPSEYH